MGATPFCQLDRRRTHPAGCAGDQHALGAKARALDHALGGGKGAGKGGQFKVRQGTVDCDGMFGLDDGELGKGPVELGSEGEKRVRVLAGPGLKHGAHNNALPHAARVDPLTHGEDLAAAIGALYPRKGQRARPSAIGIGCPVIAGGRGRIGVAAHGLGIPTRARVHVGIVDGRSAHADQDLAGCGLGDRNVFAIFQPVEATVTGQKDGFHRLGLGHGSSFCGGRACLLLAQVE